MQRGRWSFGVVVAIVVAIAVATGAQRPRQIEARVTAPVDVTLALQSDGAELRVAHDSLVLAFKF